MASGIWQELRTNGRRVSKLTAELEELTAARHELMVQAAADGIPVSKIAAELGITAEAVYKVLRSRRDPQEVEA